MDPPQQSSANRNTLRYTIDKKMKPEDFEHLAMVANDLTVEIEESAGWGVLLISFLRRMAKLAHLERHTIVLLEEEDNGEISDDEMDETPVEQALLHAIQHNEWHEFLQGFLHW